MKAQKSKIVQGRNNQVFVQVTNHQSTDPKATDYTVRTPSLAKDQHIEVQEQFHKMHNTKHQVQLQNEVTMCVDTNAMDLPPNWWQ